mmetsp:Transcript_3486/g.7674  ORF Transcript_3486/g.7674 Transcript_3486/m.7674 type:complete len:315 (-) Transcript_3486:16-960(-)
MSSHKAGRGTPGTGVESGPESPDTSPETEDTPEDTQSPPREGQKRREPETQIMSEWVLSRKLNHASLSRHFAPWSVRQISLDCDSGLLLIQSTPRVAPSLSTLSGFVSASSASSTSASASSASASSSAPSSAPTPTSFASYAYSETSALLGWPNPPTHETETALELELSSPRLHLQMQREESFRQHKALGLLPLVVLIFYEVSGGPFGVEDIVRAGGPKYALMGFSLFLVWALPQALITAELSTALPEASGVVAWVDCAFGPFWAFQEGWLSWLSGVADNALYPILFLDCLLGLFPGICTYIVCVCVCYLYNME